MSSTCCLGLMVYRGTLSMHEGDQLVLDDVTARNSYTQAEMHEGRSPQVQSRIEPLVKHLYRRHCGYEPVAGQFLRLQRPAHPQHASALSVDWRGRPLAISRHCRFAVELPQICSPGAAAKCRSPQNLTPCHSLWDSGNWPLPVPSSRLEPLYASSSATDILVPDIGARAPRKLRPPRYWSRGLPIRSRLRQMIMCIQRLLGAIGAVAHHQLPVRLTVGIARFISSTSYRRGSSTVSAMKGIRLQQRLY